MNLRRIRSALERRRVISGRSEPVIPEMTEFKRWSPSNERESESLLRRFGRLLLWDIGR